MLGNMYHYPMICFLSSSVTLEPIILNVKLDLNFKSLKHLSEIQVAYTIVDPHDSQQNQKTKDWICINPKAGLLLSGL